MKTRVGFTIIEVMLFIAISGFLIVGLMVGTSATIARQRYNDSVQDLAEFIRREYSAVINPENDRRNPVDNAICAEGGNSVGGTDDDADGAYRGRSNCLIYGRLIVFGESADGTVSSYDVIGRELTDSERLSSSTTLIDALKLANINVLVRSNPSSPSLPTCSYQLVGDYQYFPQWSARVERTADSNLATLSILIIRSPINGSVRTLFFNNVIRVRDTVGTSCTSGSAKALLPDNIADFTASDVDLCIGSDDIFALSGRRRNVRILRDGHNSSAVKIIDQDSEDNKCQE